MSLSFVARSKFSPSTAFWICSLISFSTGFVFHLKNCSISFIISEYSFFACNLFEWIFFEHHQLHNQK